MVANNHVMTHTRKKQKYRPIRNLCDSTHNTFLIWATPGQPSTNSKVDSDYQCMGKKNETNTNQNKTLHASKMADNTNSRSFGGIGRDCDRNQWQQQQRQNIGGNINWKNRNNTTASTSSSWRQRAGGAGAAGAATGHNDNHGDGGRGRHGSIIRSDRHDGRSPGATGGGRGWHQQQRHDGRQRQNVQSQRNIYHPPSRAPHSSNASRNPSSNRLKQQQHPSRPSSASQSSFNERNRYQRHQQQPQQHPVSITSSTASFPPNSSSLPSSSTWGQQRPAPSVINGGQSGTKDASSSSTSKSPQNHQPMPRHPHEIREKQQPDKNGSPPAMQPPSSNPNQAPLAGAASIARGHSVPPSAVHASWSAVVVNNDKNNIKNNFAWGVSSSTPGAATVDVSGSGNQQCQQPQSHPQQRLESKHHTVAAVDPVNDKGNAGDVVGGNNKSSRKKKGKPKLSTISIGDMILKNKTSKQLLTAGRTNGGNNNTSSDANNSQLSGRKPMGSMDLDEFPTLGGTLAASTTTPTTDVAEKDASGFSWGTNAKPVPSVVWNRPDSSTTPAPSSTANTTSGLAMSETTTKKKKKKQGGSNKSPKKSSDNSMKTMHPNSKDTVASAFFGAVPRGKIQNDRLEGDEHQLLRLMQERTIYQKKGRQRVAPRKKKFSALKKKVLQERLDQWRKLHPQNSSLAGNGHQGETATIPSSTDNDKTARNQEESDTIVIYHYVESYEELEDDDEYDEIIDNLTSMARKVGNVAEVFIPRKPLLGEHDGDDGEQKSDNDPTHCQDVGHPSFVRFENKSDGTAAAACWDGMIISGTPLQVIPLHMAVSASLNQQQDARPQWSEEAMAAEVVRRKVTPKDNSATEMESGNDPIGLNQIRLQKVLTDDDYTDEDCMAESLSDLKCVADGLGNLRAIAASDDLNGDVILTFACSLSTAKEIAENLCRTVIAGEPLYAFVVEQAQSSPPGVAATISLSNILSQEDMDDDECLAETLNDIREIALRYGDVSNVSVKANDVMVTYVGGESVANTAIHHLDGLVLGGNVLSATLVTDGFPDNHSNAENVVLVHNALSDEDFEDEDCLAESINDIRKLAAKYGTVSDVEVVKTDGIASISIHFDASNPLSSLTAAESLSGIVVGGQIIATSLPGQPQQGETSRVEESDNVGGKRKQPKPDTLSLESASDVGKKARTDDKAPLYSGDKLIPERFAEMKRVPKIPNAPGPREYAGSGANDEQVKPLLTEMLGELSRLQKRAMEENKNTKTRRRLVMGLREVARGIRSHKVKMVVMANNLDQYGAIDAKLQEIIDLAKAEDVPVFFEFTKRTLGKALGKTIKIAVVGIQSADGAHQQFKKLNTIAARM